MRSKSAAVCSNPGCTNSELEVWVLLEGPLLLEEPGFVLEALPLGLEELALPLEELPLEAVPGLLVVPSMDEALPATLPLNPAAASGPELDPETLHPGRKPITGVEANPFSSSRLLSRRKFSSADIGFLLEFGEGLMTRTDQDHSLGFAPAACSRHTLTHCRIRLVLVQNRPRVRSGKSLWLSGEPLARHAGAFRHFRLTLQKFSH